MRVESALLALQSLLLAVHQLGGLFVANAAALLLVFILAAFVAQAVILGQLVVTVGQVYAVTHVSLVVILICPA